MGYKRITLTTVAIVLIVALSSLAAGYLTAFHMNPWYLLFVIPVPLATFTIIHHFNQSNRQIAFFFEAIRTNWHHHLMNESKGWHHLTQKTNIQILAARASIQKTRGTSLYPSVPLSRRHRTCSG